jgi:hypothetical protein
MRLITDVGISCQVRSCPIKKWGFDGSPRKIRRFLTIDQPSPGIPTACASLRSNSDMSKRETPMTHRYWERVRGTLLEEYLIVPSGPGVGRRMIDAVIIEDGDHRIASRGESVSLDGHDMQREPKSSDAGAI